MAKKIPQRMCVVCRQMQNKNELLRLVQTEEGLIADASGKRQGRGLYLCSEPDCQTEFFNPRYLSKLQRKKVALEEVVALQEQVLIARTEMSRRLKKKDLATKTDEKRAVRIVKVKAEAEGKSKEDATGKP